MLRCALAHRRLVGAAAASAGATVCSWSPARAQISEQPPQKRAIHQITLQVASSVEGDFSHWLPLYLKRLLELPGMLGAKVLHPLDEQRDKPSVVFVLGGPGAGKGTQCAKIVEEFGYVHLSAGDLLRAERASGSAQGQMISEYIKEGKIVPVEVTVKLLVDAIASNGGKRFLVDGFPRNTNNLSGWEAVAGDSLQVAAVLVYDCPEEVMEARLLERGKTSGRTDDNVESIRKRFHTFKSETKPVLEYYSHKGLTHTINGTRAIEEVWEDSQTFVKSLEAKLTAQPVEVALHIHTNASDAAYVSDVAGRISHDLDARWGKGVIKVSSRALTVQRSLKAFDLESLRAFD